MCGRLNQHPLLSLARKELRMARRRRKKAEDRKSEVQVLNNICLTDYAEVGRKFGHTFNARCESLF